MQQLLSTFHLRQLLFGASSLMVLAGCGSNTPQPLTPGATPAATSRSDETSSPPQEAPPARPDYGGRLDEAAALLAAGDLSASEKILDELVSSRDALSSEEASRQAELVVQLQDRREAQADEQRESWLAEARQSLDDGELEKATAAIEKALAAGATTEQSATAAAMKKTIEERRRIQRELRSALKLLASDKRGDIKAARTRLWQQSEVALPMLLKNLESDNPRLVENTLETLRMFNQPQRTVPPIVGVLSRTSQSASWPAAIRELQRIAQPGAGPALLELAQSGESPEQREAALSALAHVVDPPVDTLVALLPTIHRDSPELAAALSAAQHALSVHKQTDLAARRGLSGNLSPEQEQLLDRLGDRLRAIAAADGLGSTQGPAGRAALALGIATRQILPQPLAGVSVLRVSAEDPLAPAAATLDGVWDQVELKNIWRHPIDTPAQIVFDLGEVRTVAAVKIWNFNEQSVSYRGWKEVEIFVSDQPALLSAVADGIVPMAPGAPQTADYSVTLQVPFVRGRYVKLQPRGYWQPNGPSGLSEVQILGF
jgi:hypothetical protein